MSSRSSRIVVTPLMIFYGVFPGPGLVVPWSFNIQFMMESGELITPHGLIAGGFVTPLASSLTSDFLIGTTPVLVWMVVEAKRLKMSYRWAYVALTFLIAFAFSCPLFLLMREVRLRSTPHDDNLILDLVWDAANITAPLEVDCILERPFLVTSNHDLASI